MLDRQVAERSVEICRQRRVLKTETVAEQARIEQPRVDCKIAEAVASKVDTALPGPLNGAGCHLDRTVKFAAYQRAPGAQRHFLPQRILRQSAEDLCRICLPQQTVLSAFIGQPEGCEPFIAAPDYQCAVPFAPRAVAKNTRRVTGVRPNQSSQHSAFGRAVIKVQIELVAIGLRIDQRKQAVFFAKVALRLHEHAAIANVRLCKEVNHRALFADYAGCNGETVDFETVDTDVEIGQNGRVRIAGQQFRHSQQRAAFRNQIANVQPAIDPAKRPPIQIDFRNGQELALGIVQHHIVQHGLAKQVAVYPANLEPHPGSRCNLCDLVCDQTFADRAVENSGEQQHRRDHEDHKSGKPFAPAFRPVVIGSLRRFFVNIGVRLDHQKA